MNIPQPDLEKADEYINNIKTMIAEHGESHACMSIEQYLRYFVCLAKIYNKKDTV